MFKKNFTTLKIIKAIIIVPFMPTVLLCIVLKAFHKLAMKEKNFTESVSRKNAKKQTAAASLSFFKIRKMLGEVVC